MSKEKVKFTFQATTLRLCLSVLLGLILVGMSTGFYFLYSSLQGTAEEVSKVQTEAASADAELQRLISLEKELKQYTEVMARAQQIVAESKSYQYQNQIINDLTHYANQAGLGITGFTFQSSQSSSTAAATTTASTSSGLKTMQVMVQTSDGARYESLLRFMHLIEQNLTRMQISNISINKGKEAGTIGAQSLTIEVYVR